MSAAWPEPEGGYRRMGDVAEPDDVVAVDQEQLSLFKIAKRWSPATVAVLLRLPEANARTHAVACAMGNAIRRDGTFAPARDGKDVIGVYISKSKRKLICQVLEIQSDYFGRVAKVWEDLNIAHRCAIGVLCLWITPLEAKCPWCKQEMHVSEPGLSVRDDPDDQSVETDKSVREIVPNPRDAMRDGERDAGSEPWISKKQEMLERLKNLPGYAEELAAKEAAEDE
jgi:hypothetical protein